MKTRNYSLVRAFVDRKRDCGSVYRLLPRTDLPYPYQRRRASHPSLVTEWLGWVDWRAWADGLRIFAIHHRSDVFQVRCDELAAIVRVIPLVYFYIC